MAVDSSVEFHEAANIFPMDDEHIDDLAEDIKQHGQRIPIELLGGKIVDGRRRFMACKIAGVIPSFADVDVDDPVSYVLSLNLHRRHLTPSQLSMVGARARDIYDREAKERMVEGAKNKGKENLPCPESGQARDAVGKAVGVSGKSIDHATRVLKSAIPEIVKAVDEGRMAVSTAAILATEPEEVQRDEALQPKRNRKYRPADGGGNGPVVEDQEEDDGKIERKGVGVIRANEAINCLIRIPKNDALRKRGFQIVMDWIKANK